jgi:hypothetical protein
VRYYTILGFSDGRIVAMQWSIEILAVFLISRLIFSGLTITAAALLVQPLFVQRRKLEKTTALSAFVY